MKVSVIVPNYNHALFLKQRIDSVLNQTFQDFELIILDDYSTDNSREIIELYRSNPKVKSILYNEKNGGSPFKQWQKGIELSSGEYIWIAESDDWAEKSFLAEMVLLIKSDERIGLCFCGSNWVDDKGHFGKDLSIYNESFKRPGKEEVKSSLIRYNTIQNASAVLIRTKLAKKNLKNIGQFKSCGDWYFYINILQESDIIYNEKKLNNFRWYNNNTSNKSSKSGLWILEGLHVLTYSKAFQNNFSFKQLKDIANYWKLKIRNSEFNNNKFKWQYYKSIAIFSCKNIAFKLMDN